MGIVLIEKIILANKTNNLMKNTNNNASRNDITLKVRQRIDERESMR